MDIFVVVRPSVTTVVVFVIFVPLSDQFVTLRWTLFDARVVRLPGLEGAYVTLLGAFVVILGCAPYVPDGLNSITGEAANSVFSALLSSRF